MNVVDIVLWVFEIVFIGCLIPLGIKVLKSRKENKESAIKQQQQICNKLDEIAHALLDLAEKGEITATTKEKLKQITQKEFNND